MMENLKLKTTQAPHIRLKTNTNTIMLDVMIALVPALIAATIFFGARVLLVVGFTMLCCVLFEYIWNKLTGKPQTIGDLSAAVTGMLLGFNLRPDFPLWQAAIGAAIAIIIIKQFFGGIGFNLVNPALGARAVMIRLFAIPLAGTISPLFDLGHLPFDVFTGATPLNLMYHGHEVPSYLQLLIGKHGGSLGETSALAILIGGIYLIARRVISPLIPVTYIATVFVLSALIGQDPIFSVLAGGLMLGAFFMATDYVTSPITKQGKFIYALALGFITVAIRNFGVFYEGVAFSIVIMNLLVPLIEKLTASKVFGVEVGEE